jgi:hypothetical protein
MYTGLYCFHCRQGRDVEVIEQFLTPSFRKCRCLLIQPYVIRALPFDYDGLV